MEKDQLEEKKRYLQDILSRQGSSLNYYLKILHLEDIEEIREVYTQWEVELGTWNEKIATTGNEG